MMNHLFSIMYDNGRQHQQLEAQNAIIAQSIKQRINDYNNYFKNTLLKGLVLEYMACQFLEGDANYFASESTNDLKAVFKELKYLNKEDSLEPIGFNYFLWKNGKINHGNFPLSIKIMDIPQKLDAAKYQLYVLTVIDINGANSRDAYILTIFKIETAQFNIKTKAGKLKKFLEYPKDFFNSPVVTRYFEDLKFQSELGEFQNEVRNFIHNIFSIYPGIINHLEIIKNDLEIIKNNLEKRKSSSKNFMFDTSLPKLNQTINSSELVLWHLRGIGRKFEDYMQEMARLQICNLKSLVAFIIKGVNTENLEFKTIYKTEDDLILNDYSGEVNSWIFSIFMNLITNASKSRSYLTYISKSTLYVTVSMWSEDDYLCISIKNPCDNEAYITNVKAKLESKKNQNAPYESKGLSIISRKIKDLEHLGWQLAPIQYQNNEIEIIIKIKKS